MNLWLDDIRPAPEGWIWVKTYDQALAALANNKIERMSFDHDLGLDPDKFEDYTTGKISEDEAEMTGYHVALWMAEHDVWPTEGCVVHSMNPVGAKNICAIVDRYGPYTKPCPWTLAKSTQWWEKNLVR